MAKINVGDAAPDFTLQDQNGAAVKLSDFRDKSAVVLIFYPGDQTPGCTAQLCSATDDSAVYEKAGAKVFGVNQGSADSHQRFISKHKLAMPLLVDEGLAVAARYDAVMGLGPLKLINRTVVGIDKAGRITFYKRGMPDTAEIVGHIAY